MFLVNHDQGDGKEGIVLENKRDVEVMVFIRDYLLDVVKEKKTAELIKGSFSRSIGKTYTEENQGMFVVSDGVLQKFNQEYTDVV